MDTETKRLVTNIFTDARTFEEQVLQLDSSYTIKDFMSEQLWEIVHNTKVARALNFARMNSYDNFSYAPTVSTLIELLTEEAEVFLEEDLKLNEEEVDTTIASRKNQLFLQQLSTAYVKAHIKLLNSIVADTLLDTVGNLSNQNKVPSAIREAINGTVKMKPIFVGSSSQSVSIRINQIFVRTKQAIQQRKDKLEALESDVDLQGGKLKGIDKNIKALRKAGKYRAGNIKDLTHARLRDIVINEDGECNDDKRIVQYIPSGELTAELVARVEKGKMSATNDIAKEEYKRTLKFMNLIHGNNTKSTLEYKLANLHDEKPVRQDRLALAEDKLDEFKRRGLANFDESLMKIKDMLVGNIGRKNL